MRVARRVAHERVVGALLDAAGGVGAREHALALLRVGQHDRGVAQRGGAGRRRRRAAALPGVRAEVMVIAAGGEECRLRAELRP